MHGNKAVTRVTILFSDNAWCDDAIKDTVRRVPASDKISMAIAAEEPLQLSQFRKMCWKCDTRYRNYALPSDYLFLLTITLFTIYIATLKSKSVTACVARTSHWIFYMLTRIIRQLEPLWPLWPIPSIGNFLCILSQLRFTIGQNEYWWSWYAILIEIAK